MQIGCAHVHGKYFFSQKDFLNEGGVALADSGFRAVKVWFDDPGSYHWNSQWPRQFASYRDIAEHPYYREFFNRPFDTYVLTILDEKDFRVGLSDESAKIIEQKCYDLTKYLLANYRGTGKTFIIAQHEGDWHLRGAFNLEPKNDPTPDAIRGMTRWYRARQSGVERARREVQQTDVRVYHAIEVNLVQRAMQGKATVTNDILPKIKCDLVSYSSWDSTSPADGELKLRERLRAAFAYLAEKAVPSEAIAPDGRPFGKRNIYIGEFGWPEQSRGPRGSEELQTVCRAAVEESINFNCPYLFYWELYDNECCQAGQTPPCVYKPNQPRPTEPTREMSLCRGFWLRRTDGSYSPAWQYLTGRLPAFVKPVEEFSARSVAAEARIDLTWPMVTDVKQYRLERSEGDGLFLPFSIVSGERETLADKTIKAGKKYRYRIRSERGQLNSGWFYTDRMGPDDR